MTKEMYKEIIRNQKWIPLIKVTGHEMLLAQMWNEWLVHLEKFPEEDIHDVLQFFKNGIINLGLSLNIEV
jgi:hypothetical protein